jgi:hypothetical protein
MVGGAVSRTAVAGGKIQADVAAEIRRTKAKADDTVERRWANQMQLVYDGMIQSGKTTQEAGEAVSRLATAAYLSPDRKIQMSIQARAAAEAMRSGGDVFDQYLAARVDYPGYADSFYRQDTNVPVISMNNNQAVQAAVTECILAGMYSPANIVNTAALKTGVAIPEFAEAGAMLSEQVKAWTSAYFDFGPAFGFSPTFIADDYKAIRDTVRDYGMFTADMDYGRLRNEQADLEKRIASLKVEIEEASKSKDAAPKGKKKSFYKAGRKAGRLLATATASLESVKAALAVEAADTLDSRRNYISAKLREHTVKSVKYEPSEKISEERRKAEAAAKRLERINGSQK